jgi:crotonobetainyl-CoA:carnitine CoA-transferase CaiB-like acyl-CoA transferase
MAGPLDGIRILDLTRILAGPFATQLLADLGADVIKVERPGTGDDTRAWGPPWLKDRDGRETSESAYYLSTNRGKRSVAIDISRPEGAALLRRIAGQSDVLVENFKRDGLVKYGLDWSTLHRELPGLVYASLTGFGQTGPYADRAGYDYQIQGMGGLMSITGEAEGAPMKVGVAISDIMTGMYLTVAILAALRHRDRTGVGQRIDLALLDAQVAWLANQATNYLVGGKVPGRLGNAHPNLVPYQVFRAADAHIVIAVGNDVQFRRFCEFAGLGALAEDVRYRTSADRVKNRDSLVAAIAAAILRQPARHWVEGLERLGVPCGPINDIAQAFSDPQVLARGMLIAMDHPLAGQGALKLPGNPIKLSESPIAYDRPPPLLGEHTDEVLRGLLGLTADEIARLREAGALG